MTSYSLKDLDARHVLQAFAPRVANRTYLPSHQTKLIPSHKTMRPRESSEASNSAVRRLRPQLRRPRRHHQRRLQSARLHARRGRSDKAAIAELISLTPSFLRINATVFTGSLVVNSTGSFVAGAVLVNW